MQRALIVIWLSIHVTAAAAEPTGSVAGKVVYRGDVPRAHVADNTGRTRRLLEVDEKSHGLRFAAVYLEPLEANGTSARETQQSTVPAGKDGEEHPAVTIDQIDETFTPHVVAVFTGQRVVFGNSDHSNHNVRTATLVPENQFNVVVGPTKEYAHRFRADRKNRPVRLLCDIHQWMSGWIYVFDHSHFAVTDRKGNFRIDNVPPGRYRLVVRQPDVGFDREQEIEVAADEATQADFTFRADDVKRFETKSTTK